jgi:hypothetical protein
VFLLGISTDENESKRCLVGVKSVGVIKFDRGLSKLSRPRTALNGVHEGILPEGKKVT